MRIGSKIGNERMLYFTKPEIAAISKALSSTIKQIEACGSRSYSDKEKEMLKKFIDLSPSM